METPFSTTFTESTTGDASGCKTVVLLASSFDSTSAVAVVAGGTGAQTTVDDDAVRLLFSLAVAVALPRVFDVDVETLVTLLPPPHNFSASALYCDHEMT